MLQEPSRYLTRISEKVEAGEGCLNLDVVMDYALNDNTTEEVAKSNEQMILIPLIKLKKREMLDNFDIRDGDDKHVAPLLQEESNGLIATVITNCLNCFPE